MSSELEIGPVLGCGPTEQRRVWRLAEQNEGFGD
jgi:hypothetical protein